MRPGSAQELIGEEREQLIDLLQKLQAGQTHLRGVHPGMGEDGP